MMAYGVDMETFMSELKGLILSLIVKREDKANLYETAAIKEAGDKYLAVLDAGDNWNSYAIFDRDVMLAAGMTEDIIHAVQRGNKEAIPFEFRSLVCTLQKEKVVSEYVEQNEYYRMLHGDPPLDATEKDYVYMPVNPYGIPTDIPIHLLNEGYIQYFNSSGLRKEVYEANKDKPYLLYLGNRSISYYKARLCRNFDIMYMETTSTKYITHDFITEYAGCREYVMKNLYNKPDQAMYKYYDSFIGFLIVHMAVQRVFASIFKQGIRREFYDDSLIRCLFEAYNIPYIDSIDTKYQRDLAKKLNILLQQKSSNAVLVDITNLFYYPDVNIYKYYLMKDYHKDENGDPIIIYKTIYDENNVAHQVIDAEKTYDIYFQKVNIFSSDISGEIGEISNRIEYQAITGGDPYWINDAQLLEKLYTSKFNSILTKYMSIDIAYELAQLMYETCHGLRMIIDDQKDYKNLYILLPFVADPVSLFDIVIFLCALVAKKFGLAGNVPLKPYQIAQVYGFNFKTDIEALKAKILEDIESCTGDYKAARIEVLSYLKTLNTATLEGVTEMYENIQSLRVWLDTAMRYTNDIDEYEAYKKIYNSVLLTYDVQELYTKKDGTFANTYAELLEDRRPDLYDIYKHTGETTSPLPGTPTNQYESILEINGKINKVLEKLSLVSDSLAEMKFVNDKDAMVSNIEKVINQMKSYTVDQTTSSIQYMLKDPHMCMLKMIDNVMGTNIGKEYYSKLKILYQDTLHQVYIHHWFNGRLIMENEILNKKLAFMKDTIWFFDKIVDSFMKDSGVNMDIRMISLLHGFFKHRKLKDHRMDLNEYIFINPKWGMHDAISFKKFLLYYQQKLTMIFEPLILAHKIKIHKDTRINVRLTLLEHILHLIQVQVNKYIDLQDQVREFRMSHLNQKLLAQDTIGTDTKRAMIKPIPTIHGLSATFIHGERGVFKFRDSVTRRVVSDE